MLKQAFDNDIYIEKQTHEIKQRINRFDGKLYLEFGGKLFDDFHASRVLPGFAPDTKIKLLQSLADQAEIIFCISADDIEKTKVRADLGISYDMDVLRLIDEFEAMGISVNSIVINKYNHQKAADNFQKANCELTTLSNYNAMIDLALKIGYVQPEQVDKLKEWRLSPETYQ